MIQPLIHTIPPDPSIAPLDSSMSRNLIPKNTAIIILMTVLLLGISTGGVVAYLSSSSSVISNKPQMIDSSSSNPQSAGVLDKKTFTDSADGILQEGGFEGEGSHHLERGAKDQTAYLTSSTIDMSPFVGKKVKVWGQTHTSEKVGWFMDVGYIEIL